MTKTKTSTIAIVVLSVLLAAALAATIVLAAFTFTRQASTTITFASGIELTVTGLTDQAWDAYAVAQDGTVDSNKIASDKLLNQTAGVAFAPITVASTANNANALRVAFAVTASAPEAAEEGLVTLYSSASSPVSKTTEITAFAGTASANYNASGTSAFTGTITKENAPTTGWFMTSDLSDTTAVNLTNYINTAFASTDLSTLSGKGVILTIYIVAAYVGANEVATIANLTEEINNGSALTFTAAAA